MLIDLRTVPPEQDELLAALVTAAASKLAVAISARRSKLGLP